MAKFLGKSKRDKMTMEEQILDKYLRLDSEEIRKELNELLVRPTLPGGTHQPPFLPVETLLTYGLFFLMDPHRYGGRNIHTIPPEAAKLAAFFKRTPGSITNKMLNLEGFRSNSARHEPLLYSYLASHPEVYISLYTTIMATALDLSIDEGILPNLHEVISLTNRNSSQGATAITLGKTTLLIGQEELPGSITELLAGKNKAEELAFIQTSFGLNEILTEKLVEQKVRLAQHRFAREVLLNCEYSCVFCGFTPPPGVPKTGSGLLRASHIKPWSVSNNKERVDIQNGLAACPTHDAAFDQGYLTVNGGYKIHLAAVLLAGFKTNEATRHYFGEATLGETLHMSSSAIKPGSAYLAYHQRNIYRDS
jgi:putative restriction endonuclease